MVKMPVANSAAGAGLLNGESFRAYVEQILVPTLKPGDVVVVDNLGSHKGHRTRAAIRAVGARLMFLPPYSPDLNPIEMPFAGREASLSRRAGGALGRPAAPHRGRFR